ncbi:MAG: hypothetical protein DRH03_05395, partial [Deltaproteobacteria bacterium]
MDLLPLVCILTAGTIGAGLLFVKPRFATWLLIVLSVFDLAFFSRWLGAPRIVGRLPYIIAFILSIRMSINYLYRKHQQRYLSKAIANVLFFSGTFFLIFLFSNTYNAESIILGFYELRYFFLLATLTFSILLYIPINISLKNFIKPFVFASLVQLPFTIMQHIAVQVLGINLSTSTDTSLDMVCGTFATYPQLVLLQSITIGLVLTYQLSTGKNILKINNYLLMLLIFTTIL